MLKYTLSTPAPAQMPTLVTTELTGDGHVNLLVEGIRVAFLTANGRLGLACLSNAQRHLLDPRGIQFKFGTNEIETF